METWIVCRAKGQSIAEEDAVYIASTKYGYFEVQYEGDPNWYQDTAMNPTKIKSSKYHNVIHVRWVSDRIQRWLNNTEGWIKWELKKGIPAEIEIKRLMKN